MSEVRQPRKPTPKQRLFFEGIVEGLSGSEAARRAGYTGNPRTLTVTASKLKRHPWIAAKLEEIAERTEQAAAEAGERGRLRFGDALLTREGRIQWLMAAVAGEIPDQKYDPKTGRLVDVRAPLRSRIKAAELLVRMTKDLDEPIGIATTTGFLYISNGRAPDAAQKLPHAPEGIMPSTETEDSDPESSGS